MTNLSIFIIATLVALGTSQTDYAANFVYGQNGLFTTSTSNQPSLSASTLTFPQGVVYDVFGGVYIADGGNNRILYFQTSTSTTPLRVYGQGGSFTSNTANLGGILATSLSSPYGVALDSANGLYVADTRNNRVLYYPSASTTATAVYGQGGSFSTNTANNGGISSTSLAVPSGVALDGNGNLYVSDSGNNRVLRFTIGNPIATAVWGQSSFATGSINQGLSSGTTASALNFPNGVVATANGLFIADTYNNRVLFYAGYVSSATAVYGQSGSYTSRSVQPLSAGSLSAPTELTYNYTSQSLYISDSLNNRVVYYYGPSTVGAAVVYGQGGSMTTNNGGTPVSSRTLAANIKGLSLWGGQLLISDTSNNRVLRFPAVDPGQLPLTTAPATSATCFHESTTIEYKGKWYTLQQLSSGAEKECRVPHVVTSDGYVITISCSKDTTSVISHLRLTGDHLIKTFNGKYEKYMSAENIPLGSVVVQSGSDSGTSQCKIVSKEKEFNQKYFGLNCLESIVYADGIQTSTFGSYHHIPSAWMSLVGRAFGIDLASRWGDSIAQWFHRNNYYN
jgi:hypothetical protein